MVSTFNNLPGTLPILDGNNYDRWHKRMKVLFGSQNVLEIVNLDIQDLAENATEVKKMRTKN